MSTGMVLVVGMAIGLCWAMARDWASPEGRRQRRYRLDEDDYS